MRILPFGVIGKAVMYFRVLQLKIAAADGSSDLEPTPWYPNPLQEKKGKPEAGSFLLHWGVFEHSDNEEQIEFHAIPSANPELVLGRKVGGGRFDFHVAKILKDRHGVTIPLKPGDQVEYKIEVFPAWPLDKKKQQALAARWDRPSGISETRTVAVVSKEEYKERVKQYQQEIAKL